MPTNTTLKEKCSRRTDDRHYLGTDADGDEHYQDATLGAIWIVREGELAYIDTTHTLDAWVARIADDCGWQDCQYSTQPTGEWLADTLAEAI